jgi:ADP-dependent NAD(P)H-hydrate dehydratase / NAD(P)H-hydrate epimerase
VIPIVAPEEMNEIDAAAPEPVDVLVGRAGAAVAGAVRRRLGGTYGRTVNVIAGKGNNGADGRVAGELLASAGVAVRLFEAAACPESLPPADLVIDAAYGTGFRGQWMAPSVGDADVVAVDIPSGVDGLTGVASPGTLAAVETVTFAAMKPGLLVNDGKRLAGKVTVADIGLDVSAARAHVVERADVAGWWRPRTVDAHKWTCAVRVVAGSPGMTGAASLAATAAMRAGAGIVWLSIPGEAHPRAELIEVVGKPCPAAGWASDVTASLKRFGALVIGPGLGLGPDNAEEVRAVVAAAPCPAVVDGDGLNALSASGEGPSALLRGGPAPTVLTPHDGEFERLDGRPPDVDRFAAVRRLASTTGAIVLLKGPTTLVAEPGGFVRAVTAGDQRLATAGTGDVLSGTIGAMLASGMAPFDAAAAGAWLHATAAASQPAAGLVASDVAAAIPQAIELTTSRRRERAPENVQPNGHCEAGHRHE